MLLLPESPRNVCDVKWVGWDLTRVDTMITGDNEGFYT